MPTPSTTALPAFLTPSKMLVNSPLGSSFACSCAIVRFRSCVQMLLIRRANILSQRLPTHSDVAAEKPRVSVIVITISTTSAGLSEVVARLTAHSDLGNTNRTSLESPERRKQRMRSIALRRTHSSRRLLPSHSAMTSRAAGLDGADEGARFVKRKFRCRTNRKTVQNATASRASNEFF